MPKLPKNPNKVAPFGKFSGAHNRAVGQRTKELAKVMQWRYRDHLSIAEIAKLAGMGTEAIDTMLAPFKVIMETPEVVQGFKANEADILDGIRFLMATGMMEQLSDPERRKTLDLSRLTWGYCALFDKARLERGESTSNVKLSLAELIQKADEIDITEIQKQRKDAADDAEPSVVPGREIPGA